MLDILWLLLGFTRNYEIMTVPMSPTLELGQVVTANNIYLYQVRGPLGPLVGPLQQGDLALFNTEDGVYAMRIVGMPGDVVQVLSGRLYINREILDRRWIGRETNIDSTGAPATVTRYEETLPNGLVHAIFEIADNGPLDNTPEYLVPPGQYFVMGDNRDRSRDSRVIRPIDEADIVAMIPATRLALEAK
jgi:signal peptidase I